jgi:hypothetical protein
MADRRDRFERRMKALISYANEALSIARRRGSGWVGRKLQGLKTQLEPLKADRRVKDLTEQISALRISG